MQSKELVWAKSLTQTMSEQPTAGRMNIENILCPVDFSEFSLKAFTYATCIARNLRSRLFVQHTVPVPPSVYLGSADPLIGYQALETTLQQAGAEMRRLAAVARLQLREVHLLVNEGDIHDRLLQGIQQNKINLVVMGTHGRKGFNGLSLGSLTERIVHEASCPVLVVCRPKNDFVTPEELQPVHLNTVIFATDFSPNSDRALAEALIWGSRWSAKVVLFHAIEKMSPRLQERADLFPEFNPYFEKQLVQAWNSLRGRVSMAPDKRLEIECEVRQGKAQEQILEFAEELGADLIVMGGKGEGMAATWGSTISSVVRDGRFPVLAAPHSAT